MIANARHATDNSGGREEMRLNEFLWGAEERLSLWDLIAGTRQEMEVETGLSEIR
jgi:hypothetical protein